MNDCLLLNFTLKPDKEAINYSHCIGKLLLPPELFSFIVFLV